jgi:hypothetical protein
VQRGSDSGASTEYVDYMLRQAETMEANSAGFLQAFAQTHPMWPWFSAVPGIGPVLSAGILAHLGYRPVPPTVGHWWRFAGLDPSQRWESADVLKKLWDERSGDIEFRVRQLSIILGRDPETVLRDATTDFKTGETKALTKTSAIKSLARIPFNRPLKTLCWKIGDQMVKLGGREDALYAKFYRQRKAEEVVRNDTGGRAELAARKLEKHPNHAQKDILATGKLPDGHVDAMARRATVKLFLSHLHELWFEVENGQKPPNPFATAIKGHAHYIAPPYRHVLFEDEKAA